MKVAGRQKETLTHMFSSEYCEIFRNIYLEKHLLTAASDFLKQLQNSSSENLLTGYGQLSY